MYRLLLALSIAAVLEDPDGEDPEVLAIAKEDADAWKHFGRQNHPSSTPQTSTSNLTAPHEERAAAMADAVASWWQRHRRQRGLLLTLTVCFSGVQ